MSGWSEDDSATWAAMADVAVPRRDEMLSALVALAPFGSGDTFRIVDIGAGDGLLSALLLERFPRASVVALDGSESMRQRAAERLARFGAQAIVRPFDLAALDWWDVLFGAGLVVS